MGINRCGSGTTLFCLFFRACTSATLSINGSYGGRALNDHDTLYIIEVRLNAVRMEPLEVLPVLIRTPSIGIVGFVLYRQQQPH